MTVALELLEGMNWRQWEAHVQGLLRFYGWRHFHAPANKPIAGRGGRAGKQQVEKGFPDVVAIRRLRGHGPELLFAELKTGSGRLTPAQRAWRDELEGYAASLERTIAAAVAAAGGELDLESSAPALGYYVWYPRDAEELERKLAGPYGINVPVDRVAELAGGDVVDELAGAALLGDELEDLNAPPAPLEGDA